METTEYELNGMVIKEHRVDGVVVGREEFPIPVAQVPQPPQPTVEDRLTNIEDTQDLILLKLEGVIV